MSKIVEKAGANLPKMGRMMETVGVDPVAAAQQGLGIAFGQALRRCARCEHGEACEAWLDRQAGGAGPAPEFCANRDYFAQVGR